MTETYLLLGSNLGNRMLHVSRAIVAINKEIGQIQERSPVYETEPWGFEHEKAFINIVIKVETSLPPREILKSIHHIEKQAGRDRKAGAGYQARELDIDILFYGQEIIREKDLTIPHPGLHERRFTLAPLADMAPGLVHPVLQKNMQQLLDECQDEGEVKIFEL